MQAETSHGGSCGKAYFGGDSTRLTKGDNFCGKKKETFPVGGIFLKERIWLQEELILSFKIWPRVYKTFFVLNSVEHEILNAHKYKNIKKFGLFKG